MKQYYIVTYYIKEIMEDLWNEYYNEKKNIGFYIDFKEKIKDYYK